MVVLFSNTHLDKKISDPSFSTEEEGGTGILTVNKTKPKKPPLYKVLLHNDDYTTMEFVVYVLKRHFGKTEEEAMAVMLKVHNDGMGICGHYTFEIAESKVSKVMGDAEKNGHPLKCTFEPE